MESRPTLDTCMDCCPLSVMYNVAQKIALNSLVVAWVEIFKSFKRFGGYSKREYGEETDTVSTGFLLEKIVEYAQS